MVFCTLGSCDTVLGTEPFDYAIIDNFLATEFYEHLVATFPFKTLAALEGERAYKQPGKAVQRFDGQHRENIWKFAKTLPIAWADFFLFCQSGAFCALVEKTFGRKFGTDKVQFEISAIDANGGAVHPHYDSGSKIVSGIFYMPGIGWQPEWGGALRLLRYTGEMPATPYPIWKDCAADVRAAYVPNRLVLFIVKKYKSYHGVKPMLGPAGAMRTSVTFALMREEK